MLKITYIQLDIINGDIQSNLFHLDNLLDKIVHPTDLIILPETFNTGFDSLLYKCAETVNGRTIIWLREQAKNKNCIICGSLYLKDKDRYYNSLIWMRPDGTFGIYNKKHAFRMGGEHQYIDTSGNDYKVFRVKGWKIRPFICYDLRFPVWSRNRFVDGEFEYDIAVYVANWPQERSNVWNQLLIARAIENQSFVIGVNRVGIDAEGHVNKGDSQIISPQGIILSHTTTYKEEIVHYSLDLSSLRNSRKEFPVFLDWD